MLSGVFAGVALFFSYEIGVFTIAGAFAAALLLWIVSRRVPWDGLAPAKAAAFFAVGTSLGALPFVIYLAMNGALEAGRPPIQFAAFSLRSRNLRLTWPIRSSQAGSGV